MSWTVVVRERAQNELVEATVWYESVSKSLGDRFGDAFAAALVRLADNPLQYQVVDEDIRQVQLHRFPYLLLYSVSDHEVVILSCFDGRSDPVRRSARAP